MNKDRVVVVTGAGSGIGRAAAELLDDQGANVVAVDLSDATLSWAESRPGILRIPGSVADQATNDAMVAAAVEAYGRLDALVLNAGVASMGDITRGSMEDFDRMMEVNVRAVAVGMKTGLEAMDDGGSVVVTGSVSGMAGDPGLFAYNASKGAVVNMARAVALDVAHRGIRVNAVCPGPIKTGMTEQIQADPFGDVMAARVPLGRFGEPSEVAKAIAFLTSTDSSFITGVALPVDGGVTSGTGQWPTYGARRAGSHEPATPTAGESEMNPSACSIPELVRWSTETYAERTAIKDGEVTLTYQQLGSEVDRAARAMVSSGISAGETVAVWAPNCWQWVVAGLAASRAGARLVPINTRFKGGEAAYVLRAADVRLLFVVDGFLNTNYSASVADQDLPALKEVINLSGPASANAGSFGDFLARGDAEIAETLQVEVDKRTAAVTAEDIGLIMFTSGTTGNPKGVMVRGGAIIRAFHDYGKALTVKPGDPYLLVNPYFHAFGYNSGVIVCLMFGAINLPVATYEAGEVLQTIERERVTVFPGPPALFQGLLNHPDLDKFDVSSLRACVTGAASIPVEMIVAMRERLGFEIVITAYGMTETSGLASYTLPNDPPEVAATTSGKAIPDGELRIVDEAGTDVPVGTEGELLVRGYQVTPGYLDAPEQTAEAIDPDGWLHTGDIAVMNADGYIDITDRKKDMFIMGGFNAYPAEIERMMVEHPQIGIAAVIGVPDARMGEVGAAFVVPAPGVAPEPAELIAWCREQMANYKVPRHLWVVDDLPLTASNKVRKPDLREWAKELLDGVAAAD